MWLPDCSPNDSVFCISLGISGFIEIGDFLSVVPLGTSFFLNAINSQDGLTVIGASFISAVTSENSFDPKTDGCGGLFYGHFENDILCLS